MNLANKLTLFRIIIVPFFVFFMCFTGIEHRYLYALILFVIASVTDMLDGKVARKYNMITSFGKFLDPLADKILVAAALICFVDLRWTSAWVVFIIIAREFVVSGVRLVAAGSEKKVVIPAGWLGKVKTAVTMAAICVILFMHILEGFRLIADESTVMAPIAIMNYDALFENRIEPMSAYFPIQIISDILMYASAALTLASGVKYLYDYREFIDPKK